MARVLVVDDGANVRMVARVVLENAGFDVVEASDGAEAIRVLRDGDVDLVLTDLFMPDVDGLELIRQLRRELPSVRVVAMSGGGYEGRIDLLSVARVLGAAEIVQKPFTQRTLVAAIERALAALPGDHPDA